jgi:hypothetical protein
MPDLNPFAALQKVQADYLTYAQISCSFSEDMAPWQSLPLG